MSGAAGTGSAGTVDPSELSAAVVGTGFIGLVHAEALRRLGVRIAGMVGSTPSRAREKVAGTGLAVYDDIDAALADPGVDVVHVATPNHLHAAQAHAALDAGKHVVCEKPLGLDSAETAALVAHAHAAGVVHAVCLNLRFYPLVHQLRALVADEALGAPRLVTGSYLQDWLLRATDWSWRLEPEKAGALRAVADIGSHWLDLAEFTTGRRITEVMADLHTLVPVRRHPPGPVETFAAAPVAEDGGELVEEAMSSDDAAGVLLRLEGGARGLVGISQVSAGRKNAVAIEVDGAEASAWWHSEDPERLWVGHRGRSNEVIHRDPALLAPSAARLVAYPGGHVEGYPDTFRALFGAIYADVARGGPAAAPAYPTFAVGDHVIRVTEAIAESARDDSWTAVADDAVADDAVDRDAGDGKAVDRDA